MARGDYKDLVAQAEKAVASVSDLSLKKIAFERVLNDLLHGDRPASGSGRLRTQKASAAPTSSGKRTKGGPMAYIEELIDDSFFENRKSSADVLTELADRAHHISGSDAGVTLLRLCKAKRLRRKKDGKTYMYSNW